MARSDWVNPRDFKRIHPTGMRPGMQPGTFWEKDALRDVYKFNYPCGHHVEILGAAMQKAGQVAPPICPTCHGQKVVDQMEAANWRENPYWSGYSGTSNATNSSTYTLIPGATGPLAWLDLQLNRVRQKAWT